MNTLITIKSLDLQSYLPLITKKGQFVRDQEGKCVVLCWFCFISGSLKGSANMRFVPYNLSNCYFLFSLVSFDLQARC